MAVGTTLGAINVVFGADTSGLASGIKGATDMLGGFGSMALGALGGVGIALGAVTAAALGVGVASTVMAADFQQQVNRLVTGAGDITDNMKQMGASILDVSVATGQMTGPLNQAMYLIISSGQRGAEALDTLSVAARGAVIEQASVVDVANTLSGVMTNYGTANFNATQYMNGLITAVQQGKITLQQLATSMGPIDPIAQQLGIHFNDVAAAMTTQTNAMLPAARAATGLRFMMLALENPTKKATDAMQAMGLNTIDVANEMKVSLPGALQMIYDAAKKAGPEGSVPFNRAIQDMTGGVRSFTTVMALTGTHMKDFINNSNLILKAMQQNKDAVIGWNIAQGNFNTQMSMASASVNALFITIGQYLLPVLTGLLSQITPTIQAFTDWITQSGILQNAMNRLSGFLGAVGQGFHDVFDPLKQVTDAFPKLQAYVTGMGMTALPPLSDALDRVNNVIHWTGDSLDRMKGSLSFVSHAFDPLTDGVNRTKTALMGIAPDMHQFDDAWDRANKVVAPMSDALDRTSSAWAKTGNTVANATTPLQAFWVGVKHIWDTLMAVDWGKIGQNFNNIGTAIGKVDWGAVGKAVQDMATGFIKVDWGKVGKALGDIATAISKVDWAPVVKGVGDLATALGKIDWASLLDSLKNVGQGISDLGKVIQITLGPIWDGLMTLVKGFQWLSDKLVGHSIIPDMINAIVKWFTDLPGKIMSGIGKLAGQVGTFFVNMGTTVGKDISTAISGWGKQFSDFATACYQAGASIVKSIGQGISDGVSWVTNAISGVLAAARRFLPFSPAKEGPLVGLEYAGSQIPALLSAGMLSGMPAIKATMNTMLAPIVSHAPINSAASSNAGGTPIVIQWYMDSMLMGETVGNTMMKLIQLKQGIRGGY